MSGRVSPEQQRHEIASQSRNWKMQVKKDKKIASQKWKPRGQKKYEYLKNHRKMVLNTQQTVGNQDFY